MSQRAQREEKGIPDKGTPCRKALRRDRQRLVCSRPSKANVAQARLGAMRVLAGEAGTGQSGQAPYTVKSLNRMPRRYKPRMVDILAAQLLPLLPT